MSLRTRDFLLLVRDGLSPRLPSELADFQYRIMWNNLQVYYWRPRVHFEVWPQQARGLIEIGLHFEGPPDENYRWGELLAERALEVQAALGSGVELEEWTSSWVRLHQTLAFADLDVGLAQTTAEKLGAMIAALQPILEEERQALGLAEALEPEEAVRSRSDRRERHWRKRKSQTAAR